MPGTIQVSILGLVGLPSSQQSSAVSIRVSVGKQTHDTKEEGDLSFSLASLRDNLNVWIHDSEGNDIAHTVVETRSIVEKGIWDDMFALQGGGQVHMRLHFNLNEYELNRIRRMRESATKKKQEDLLKRSRSSSDLAVASGGSYVSSQDPQRNAHQTEERSVAHANTEAKKTPASDAELLSKAHHDQKTKQVLPTSLSASELDKLPVNRQKVAQVTNSQHKEQKSSSNKWPSNVRKMILAFESSPEKEEVSATDATRESPQISSSNVLEVPPKSSTIKKNVAISFKPVLSNSETAPATPAILEGIGKERGATGDIGDPFQENVDQKNEQLKKLRVQNIDKTEPISFNLETAPTLSIQEGTEKERSEFSFYENPLKKNLGNKNEQFKELKFQNVDQISSKEGHMEEKIFPKKLHRQSTIERHKFCNWNTLAQEFPSRKRAATEIFTDQKWRSKHWKSSQHSMTYKVCHVNELSSNSFRGWIFLDETISPCILNDGRPIVDLLEGCLSNPDTSKGKIVDADVVTSEDSSKRNHQSEEVDSVSPPNNGGPRRPHGQVIKIAIMVSFGLLVLFARQRT